MKLGAVRLVLRLPLRLDQDAPIKEPMFHLEVFLFGSQSAACVTLTSQSLLVVEPRIAVAVPAKTQSVGSMFNPKPKVSPSMLRWLPQVGEVKELSSFSFFLNHRRGRSGLLRGSLSAFQGQSKEKGTG